jgi:hypothetical protein
MAPPLRLLHTTRCARSVVVMKWTRPLCGPASMSQNDFKTSENIQRRFPQHKIDQHSLNF